MARTTHTLKLADSIVVAAVRLTRTLRGLRRSADLSEPEISALAAIVYSKGVFARDLAAWEGVTPATISRLVAEIEAKGLVRRTLDKSDARLQWIAATALGKRRVRDGHLNRLAPLANILATLPRSERETLAAAAAILDAAIARLQGAKEED